MAIPTNFEEDYKTISNAELVTILENPGEYQPMAIEAAKKEFASRQLSETEINEAKKPLILKELQQRKQKEKVEAIEDKVKNSLHTLIDTLNPIQPAIPTTERTIRIIVVVFGIIFLYQFISDYYVLIDLLLHLDDYAFAGLLISLPFVLLPLAIFTFWKRKKLGWILLTIYLTFSFIALLWTMFISLTRKPSGFAVVDNFFPAISVTTYIIQLLFLAGTLYIICKQNIREVYAITTETLAVTIGLAALFTFLSVLAIT